MTNPFTSYKFHPHSVGHLMTSLPGLTPKQMQELDELQERFNGIGRPLTDNMKARRVELFDKFYFKETPDTLPQGAKTHLDDIYRGIVWKRKDIVETIYMDKGNYTEQDCLDLLSETDDYTYFKNKNTIENDWMVGTPDVWPVIKDTKSCWNLRTFDQSELTSLYDWQVRAYVWITMCSDDTYTLRDGELIYCLVNAPGHMVSTEIDRIYYRYSAIPGSDRWLKLAQQIERNLIFDVAKFKEENKMYTFINEDLDFTIPERFRIKRFTVTLTSDDITAFETRLPSCREYLIKKWEKDFTEIPAPYTKTEMNI